MVQIVFQVGIFVVIAVVVIGLMRRGGGKPKETEAKLVKRTERREGPVVNYTFEFELKDGKRKTFTTQEKHYAKLEEDRVGMLAYRGRSFIDFEMYDKHVRM